ncbi:unnamed protein product [Parascedosporium putredinis]|uniref:40S ribosomal protein S21 n=1 Tax=Parascedosporium putredinis TaxID=1442378 RepID=A0A9P1HAH0_9PEZI|nr:unnamed protein product [Parascedosporium putredinis]CAI8001824.1 unnamed protein product [Parascedosporium putredinis]
MENDKGETVDLATNRIIKAKDHASVQISIAKVDDNGRAIQGENIVYALCGFVRAVGESDDSSTGSRNATVSSRASGTPYDKRPSCFRL